MAATKGSPNPTAAWLRRIEALDGPAYRRIAQALENAVAEGELQAGDQIPAQREVARLVGIDFTTVTRAYALARERGLIEGTTGRGTFVRSRTDEDDAGLVDLSMNLPPPPAGLNLARPAARNHRRDPGPHRPRDPDGLPSRRGLPGPADGRRGVAGPDPGRCRSRAGAGHQRRPDGPVGAARPSDQAGRHHHRRGLRLSGPAGHRRSARIDGRRLSSGRSGAGARGSGAVGGRAPPALDLRHPDLPEPDGGDHGPGAARSRRGDRAGCRRDDPRGRRLRPAAGGAPARAGGAVARGGVPCRDHRQGALAGPAGRLCRRAAGKGRGRGRGPTRSSPRCPRR
jgi:hypothetical protein